MRLLLVLLITVELTANHSEKYHFHATAATLDLEFIIKLYRSFRSSQRIPSNQLSHAETLRLGSARMEINITTTNISPRCGG
jgi:hypothetical protein